MILWSKLNLNHKFIWFNLKDCYEKVLGCFHSHPLFWNWHFIFFFSFFFLTGHADDINCSPLSLFFPSSGSKCILPLGKQIQKQFSICSWVVLFISPLFVIFPIQFTSHSCPRFFFLVLKLNKLFVCFVALFKSSKMHICASIFCIFNRTFYNSWGAWKTDSHTSLLFKLHGSTWN